VTKPGLRNLLVLLRGHSADTHRTDNLTIHNHWYAALQ
jgi:hypothetical protein